MTGKPRKVRKDRGKNHRLTLRQRRFVAAYLANGGNAAAAAREAGYAQTYAREYAVGLMRNARIRAAIARHERKLLKPLHVSAQTLTFEAARLAFSDIRRLFDGEGRLKPVAAWDDDMAAAVSSIEVKHTADGDLVTKVKLWSKPEAQRNLAVMMGLIKPFQRRGEDDERAAGMERRELRESLAALTDEQRAQLREIAETLAARRRAGAAMIEAPVRQAREEEMSDAA